MVMEALLDAPKYNEAVKSAEQAFIRQVHLDDMGQKILSDFTKLSPTAAWVGGAAGVSFRVYRDKQLQYRYRNMSTTIRQNLIYLEYKWTIY